MRLGRQWVQERSQGKRVLNLFAYTCGFSVAAKAGGANQVVNVDMAKGALSRGRDNHRLNEHDMSDVTFMGYDIFRSWGKITKYGPYDLAGLSIRHLFRRAVLLGTPKITNASYVNYLRY